MPVTSIPSASPSLAGWVASASTTTATTEAVDEAVIDGFVSDLANYYGVETTDIETTTVYTATGSLEISLPEGVSEAELVDAVSASIAESLGVHPQDVAVTVDMETGSVEFSVTSEDFDEASQNQFDLDNDNIQNSIVNAIETAVPEATVDSYEVEADVTATIEFTIDADDATNDRTQAEWQSEQLLSSFGDVEIESKYADEIS